jgi:hypothetical protein
LVMHGLASSPRRGVLHAGELRAGCRSLAHHRIFPITEFRRMSGELTVVYDLRSL